MYGSVVKLQSQRMTAQQQKKKNPAQSNFKENYIHEKYLNSSPFVPSPSKAGFANKVLLHYL